MVSSNQPPDVEAPLPAPATAEQPPEHAAECRPSPFAAQGLLSPTSSATSSTTVGPEKEPAPVQEASSTATTNSEATSSQPSRGLKYALSKGVSRVWNSGGVSPDEGRRSRLAVVFKDLTYTVPNSSNRRETLTLLKGVSCIFEPGQMTAVMGPSGSGKSTLLDVCAGRKTQGTISGTLLYGDSAPSPALLRRYTGYVEQFDSLLDNLTVYEMLLYTAELKQPRSKPLSAKKDDVERLIDRLVLESCRDTRIGKALNRGISGGQAKRTNVGIALITQPRVLFLDEPTSGLDSFTAQEVMAVVKGLVTDGTTICSTIHSPSAECFALFDKVMVVASGWVVYCGPPGTAAASYLSLAFDAPPLPLGQNASDHIIGFLAQADRDGRSAVLHELYSASSEAQDVHARVEIHVVRAAMQAGGGWLATVPSFGRRPVVQDSSADSQLQQRLHSGSQYVTPAWWSFAVLVQYRALRNYSHMSYIGPRLWDKLAFALFMMGLYFSLGDKFEAVNIPAIAAAVYLVVAEAAKTAVAYVPGIMLERDLYVREQSDGLYRPITYLLYKVWEELMLNMVIGLITCAAVFFGIEMQGSFLYYYITAMATLSNGIAISYAVAAWSPSLDVANAAVQTILTFMAYLSGFPIRHEAQPWYMRWFGEINPLRYCWVGLMKNQFEGHPEAQIGGMPVLRYMGLEHVTKWELLGYIMGSFGAWCSLAWIGLAFVKHHKR